MLNQAQFSSNMQIAAAAAPSAAKLAIALPALKGWTLILSAIGTTITALTLSVLVINNQTFQNEALEALLLPPESCEAPCWEGIQPGETTADEAIDLLQNHPWVLDVVQSPGKISWWWNGEQPEIYDDRGRAFHGRIELATEDGVDMVAAVVLQTFVPYGDVALTLGEPDALTVYAVPQTETTRSGVVQVADFETSGVTAFTLLGCPLEVTDFWAAPSMIAFGQPTLAFQGAAVQEFETGARPTQLFRDNGSFCQ